MSGTYECLCDSQAWTCCPFGLEFSTKKSTDNGMNIVSLSKVVTF